MGGRDQLFRARAPLLAVGAGSPRHPKLVESPARDLDAALAAHQIAFPDRVRPADRCHASTSRFVCTALMLNHGGTSHMPEFSTNDMHAHEVPELDPQPRDADGHGYVDFLASTELSVGLAVWPAGAIDRHQPHKEDEGYYVISGRGSRRGADEERRVKPGSPGLVAAGAAPRFLALGADLPAIGFLAR